MKSIITTPRSIFTSKFEDLFVHSLVISIWDHLEEFILLI